MTNKVSLESSRKSLDNLSEIEIFLRNDIIPFLLAISHVIANIEASSKVKKLVVVICRP